MRIENNYISYLPPKKVIEENKTSKFQGKRSLASSPCNPDYYKAINIPSFSGKKIKDFSFYIKAEDGVYFEVKLNPFEARRLLYDNENSIDKNYLKSFMDLLDSNLKDLYMTEKNTLNRLNSYSDNSQKTSYTNENYMEDINNLSIYSDETATEMEEINSLPPNEKNSFIEELKSQVNSNIEELGGVALDMTKKFFDLSWTNDGFDFSNEKLKMACIKNVEIIGEFYDEYGDFGEEIFNKIVDASTKDGRIDCSFAYCLSEMLIFNNNMASTEKIADVLEKCFEKDPDSKKEIWYGIKLLADTNYKIEDDNNCFEELFSLCFDKNNKYQPNKMSKLLEMITYTSLMSEKYQNTKILEKAQKRAYDMIFTYFEDNTDKEGKLTINPELPKKYVQKRSLSDTKNKAERVL